MPRREKTEFILEQMRLCLAKKDYTRSTSTLTNIAIIISRKINLKFFDRAIKAYPEFADALYYKGACLRSLGKQEEATKLIEAAKKYGKQGYTINEDNVIYERYPYQLRWQYWD